MDTIGQHVSSSQLAYSYTQDLVDIEFYSVDNFNIHQQNLHQPERPSSLYDKTDYQESNADPYWWLDDFVISPSYLNGNGSRDLPSDHANSQAQVLTPAGYEEPESLCLPNLSHDDIIEMVKPPYSYSALIAMALQNAPEKKLTLRQICNYVVDNFPYFTSKNNWQKSIKDNLSYINCFKKVVRANGDPGKGAYWTINPNCATIFNYNFKGKWKKCNKCSKHSKTLDNKKNVKSLSSDSLAGSPASKITYSSVTSPALDTSPYFANFTSTVISMSHGASTQLTEDFSPFTAYFNELSTYPTDDHHNFSLPGESTPQVNLLQALALPNQLEEPVFFSHQPSRCEPNAL
ncbi:forkhead box protein I2-like [Phyllobates terribilis]|uniref:forkhead box protein I2-like n=1 Tax=Phyllobates terribilis TaxID=111132 RepID=UPI003CCA9FD4